MSQILIISLLLITPLLGGILIYARKKLKLEIKVQRFLDSFEYQDFETVGRIRRDYYAWKDDSINLPVAAEVKSLMPGGRHLPSASYDVSFYINTVHIPEEFEVFLKKRDSLEEFTPRYLMTEKCKPYKNGKIEFDIVVRRMDSTRILLQPEPFIFELYGIIKNKRNLFLQPVTSRFRIDCFIGPELGKVWAAFDPGTIGTCICAGSSQELKIHMEQDPDKSAKITPSIITFNKELEPNKTLIMKGEREIINKSLYLIGYDAMAEIRLGGRVSFQSIKKLLGYNDEINITFKNGNELAVNGSILSRLLVEGVFDQFKQHLEKLPNRHSELLENKVFNPLRAIVAVPNNFTAVKINDMINCIKNLNQFREIRYITEAESILCYYVFNRFQLNPPSKENNERLDETIMVFDMGGATINATIADVFQEQDENRQIQYNVAIDSQIGYSVGGDSIDYCIAKTIMSFKNEIPELEEIDPFEDDNLTEEEKKERAKKIQSQIFELKKLIIERYYGTPLIMKGHSEFAYPKASTIQDIVEILIPKSDEGELRVLLTPFELAEFLSNILDIEISIDSSSELFKLFCSDGLKEYPIFGNDFFQKFVYQPIREATEDALKLSDGEGSFLDTVIFTGRSCLFPRVKETVVEVVRQVESKFPAGKKINPTFIRSLGSKELKTAVVQGACYYGMYSHIINLSPERVNSTIGVKQTLSAAKNDFEFHALISAGVGFSKNGHTNSVKGIKQLSNSFHFDGTHVNFFQITGRDPVTILKEDMKHKYSKIASIPIHLVTSSFGAEIFQNGFIETFVKTVDGKEDSVSLVVPDQEVRDANHEHYTWVVG